MGCIGLSQDHQPKKAQSIMTELFYHKETIAPDLSDEELADLFYSHPESENYPGALTVTQHTINTSPPFLRLMGTPTSIPNDTRVTGAFVSLNRSKNIVMIFLRLK
ncbi:hypothetical protein KZ770_20275 [Escherichia coli]|nr:hypothetical protein [Escherichia coli]